MKQYILGLTMAAALTFTVSGCSDFLDEPILGQQDMETISLRRTNVPSR